MEVRGIRPSPSPSPPPPPPRDDKSRDGEVDIAAQLARICRLPVAQGRGLLNPPDDNDIRDVHERICA